jgi:phosphodiesterase/alkaline phosphatase D-like protein
MVTTGALAKPYLSRAADRPVITHGIQSGDVTMDGAVVWARADRPARMLLEAATSSSFKSIRSAVFVDALPETDFAVALGDGPPRGREIEVADLLSFIKHAGVHNTVWITADMHYTAAIYYDPNRAVFQDFEPFWEFISGPLHAGTWGPGDVDNTFGARGLPEGLQQRAGR